MNEIVEYNEDALTPSHIVKELDKYIIGQQEAKKAVAIAIRNRWRRKHIPENMRDEVAPKNIIMMGSTGVGKTEIARRLAKLVHAPFLKVEATKYTEIGYVGRDVESMVRDLVNIAINDVKAIMRKRVEGKAEKMAEDKLVELLMPTLKKEQKNQKQIVDENGEEPKESEKKTIAREQVRQMLREGRFDDSAVDVEVTNKQSGVQMDMLPGMGFDDAEMLQSFVGNIMPDKKKKKKMSVRDARQHLIDEFAEQLIDMDKIVNEAIYLVENMGIIFLDELDKIASPDQASSGSQDVARHGVQRDLLPIVEGTGAHTKYGVVKTDHILFVAAGAFHHTKPSDLIPELQGRFPIRVELNALSSGDFYKILTVPENAITKQYVELMKTEGVELEFAEDALNYIAEIAFEVNSNTENIGARRLYTIMEKIIEDLSFDADTRKGEKLVIDRVYASERLSEISKDRDLSKYIL